MNFREKVEHFFAILEPLADEADSKERQQAVLQKIESARLLLEHGDSSELEKIFAFLMLKKGLNQGGYLKERLCRLLKKMNFDAERKAILQEIVLKQIVWAGREFRDYMKLLSQNFHTRFQKESRRVR